MIRVVRATRLTIASLFALALAGSAASGAAPAPTEPRVSRPGEYRGWSVERFDGYVLESKYVAVRDGMKLAVDVFRPALNGRAADGKFPVVWTHTPYRRAYFDAQGRRISALDSWGVLQLVRHGYVLAAVDTRGRGASFGARRGFQDRTEAQDAYDITEWLAAQPWSTGNVGVTGCSYTGGSTFQMVTLPSPHLKAIAPGCTDYDKFGFIARGGILAQFNTRPENPEQDFGQGVAPVADDVDGKLAAAAIEQHKAGTSMADLWKGMPFRDDVSPLVGTRFWDEVNVARYRDVIEKSGVAIFLWGNFRDEGSFEAILAAHDLRNPMKLWMGGFGHCQVGDFPMGTELLRFFDRYLKGVENGWDREPRMFFHTDNAPAEATWRSTDRWPLAGTVTEKWRLASAATADAAGGLSNVARAITAGADAFTVDYKPVCRDPTDMYFMFWPCVIDRHGLAWETAPLDRDRHLAGHPLADLWIAATTPDADVFTYLEDVAPDGRVEIVTHGRLRASFRAEQRPPYREYFGLPWHRGLRADAIALVPGEPARLRMDLLPVSLIVKAGHRLRFRVAGADPRQRFRTVAFDPAPVITVLRDSRHASSISLPFAPSQTNVARIVATDVPAAKLVPATATSLPYGAASVPGANGSLDLAALGYVEEEYFVTGQAKRYAYDAAFEVTTAARDVPYVTRILVRKPKDPRRFNGVVHLEAAHPQYGGASNWSATGEWIVKGGGAYVLATVGEDALTRGGPVDPAREPLRAQLAATRSGPHGALSAMRALDPERYAALVWPDDDGPRWDAFAQIAALIKSPAAGTPFAGYRVARTYAAGWSFTGSLLRTFIDEGFHDRAGDRWGRPLIDGYLIGISAGPFVSGMVSLTTGTPALPVGHARRTLRAVDVPVIELMTENEAITNTSPPTPDVDTGPGRHRLYEVAGLTHGDSLRRPGEATTQYQLRQKGLAPAAPSDPCPLEKSDVPMDALARAALANLHDWVERGTPPPRAPRIDFAGPRDPFGNLRGGVRVAQLDVPLAAYREPGADAPTACRTRGPFLNVRRLPTSSEILGREYGSAATYLERFSARLDALVAERWLRREDASSQLAAARTRAAAAFAASAASPTGPAAR